MKRRPPRATRTDTLCPYTALVRAGGHGLLLGGGSAANLHAGGAAVTQALRQPGKTRGQLVLYTSSETHLSLAKAARFVGVGHIRALPVDADRRLPAAVLREAMDADRAAGLVLMLAVGLAGTANAGSIVSLADLAEARRAADMWFLDYSWERHRWLG